MNMKAPAFVCIALASYALCASTTYKVWTIHESNAIREWSVVDDNGNWTWTETGGISTGNCTKPRAACAGQNEIFVADDTGKIVKYDTDGTYKGTIATGLPQPQSICLSPDKTTLYLASLASGKIGIHRYPLADFSSGGEYIMKGTYSLNGPRHIFFGEDGLLYVCSRASGDAANSGVQAFDVSGASPVLKTWYFPKWNNQTQSNNGSCCLDIANGQLVMQQTAAGALVFDYVAPENATGEQVFPTASATTALATSFGSISLGGTLFAANYDGSTVANNKIVMMDSDGSFTNVSATCSVKALRSFVDVTSAIDESALGQLKVRWLLDESSYATVFKSTSGADVGRYDIIPRRWIHGGVTGVSGNGLWFRGDDSRLEFLDSKDMVPASGDFSIVLWVGFPESVGRMRNILNNNNNGQGRFALLALSDHKARAFIGYSAGNIQLTGSSSISDGCWHQIAFVRRDAKAELWVDGKKEAEDDFPDDRLLATGRNWASGQIAINNNEKTGKMFLDEIAIYSAALSKSDIQTLYDTSAPDGAAELPVPTEPSMPMENLSAAAAYGTMVEHVNALDGRIGAPALFIDGGGTYWLAHDYGREELKPDNNTVVLKSSDRGATWAIAGSNEVTAASFFMPDGCDSPALAGLKNGNVSTFCFGATSDNGRSYVSSTFNFPSPHIGGWHPQSLVCWSNKWYVSAQSGWCAFAVSAGVLGAVARAAYSVPNTFTGTGWGGTGAGVIGIRPDGAGLDMFVSETPSSTWTTAAETVVKMRITAAGAATVARPPFPGGMKPVGMAYDSVGKKWWAAVVPDRRATHVAGTTPAENRRVLALYASKNLDAWEFVTDVIADVGTTAGVAFNDPAIAFDGNDLVLAFGLAAPDGDIGPRGTESNYLVVRKVANFRSLPCGGGTATTTIYVVHGSPAYVGRYSWCADTGELLDGGIFASGTHGGQSMQALYGIAATRNRLFTSSSSASKPYVWEFNRKTGEFVRLLNFGSQIQDIAVSPNGRWLFATDVNSQKRIYRCDTSSGTISVFTESKANGGLADVSRGMVAFDDGSLAFVNRQKIADGGGLFRADESGGLIGKLADIGNAQALWYSSKTDTYHVHTIDKEYCTVANGTKTTLCNSTGVAYVFSIVPADSAESVLLASRNDGSEASLGILSSSGYSMVYSGPTGTGCATSWTDHKPGMAISIR